MIALDTTQLLAAVQRSLNAHVLPNLEDEFARVQIAAALMVLDEVNDRLTNGDPIIALTAHIESDALALARDLRKSTPDFADAIESAVKSVQAGLPPREHNRHLVENLWPLAADDSTEGGAALLKQLVDRGAQASVEDAKWMCTEALLSLA